MITLKSYAPYRKRSIRKVITETTVSVIMFLITWIFLVLGLGLSPN